MKNRSNLCLARVSVFQLQQHFFAFQAAGIAGESALGADYAVAGNEDRDGIAAVGLARRPGGLGSADLLGQPGIAAGLAIGNLSQSLPDLALKFRALRRQRQVKILPPPFQILQPLLPGPPPQRRGPLFLIARPRRPLKKQVGDSAVLLRQARQTQAGFK